MSPFDALALGAACDAIAKAIDEAEQQEVNLEPLQIAAIYCSAAWASLVERKIAEVSHIHGGEMNERGKCTVFIDMSAPCTINVPAAVVRLPKVQS